MNRCPYWSTPRPQREDPPSERSSAGPIERGRTPFPHIRPESKRELHPRCRGHARHAGVEEDLIPRLSAPRVDRATARRPRQVRGSSLHRSPTCSVPSLLRPCCCHVDLPFSALGRRDLVLYVAEALLPAKGRLRRQRFGPSCSIQIVRGVLLCGVNVPTIACALLVA